MRLQKAFCEAFAHKLRGAPARMPYGTEPLWEIFAHLSGSRQMGQHGPQPIGLDQFEAWGRITGAPLQPHHIAFLQAVDQVYLNALAERWEQTSALPRSKPVSSTGITPALLDGETRGRSGPIRRNVG